jgi:hypothetical protein
MPFIILFPLDLINDKGYVIAKELNVHPYIN